MIVVDSSALVAILEQEPEANRFLATMQQAPRRLASAVNIYETGLVISIRRGHQAASELAAFLEALAIEIVPFAEPFITQALDAYGRYGKRFHSKARLNLGDCVAYALARSLNAPLLFKGADFVETDVLLPN